MKKIRYSDSCYSVFGFVERSTLYGGRQFFDPVLNDDDVKNLMYLNKDLEFFKKTKNELHYLLIPVVH